MKLKVSTKCPRCDKETDKFMTMGGIKMPVNCSKCSIELSDRTPLGKPYEFTTDEIRKGRKEYKQQLYQPYRQGEFSKEFRDANPKVAKGMVKEGVITEKQYKKAKNVWGRDVY